MHPLVQLAKETIEKFILDGQIMEIHYPLADEMTEKAGTFVSIKKKGELRGCIGTFHPAAENMAAEIIQNAISAATRDPRFPPVTADELDDLEYSVDVLSAPERIKSRRDLDPKIYGVIVVSGANKGLLLPDLDGVDTVDDQISIASAKAGIYMDDDIELYRFKVKRYK
ncbi:MAG: AmmeMemoRadiSam system protein A [Nitrospiraceae bacterium]|nr:MAG: AmmeMemoRadiSam system protein A [Nitrospiraceae bacterium]